MKHTQIIALSVSLLISALFSGCSRLFSAFNSSKPAKAAGEYAELIGKKEELANLVTTETLSSDAKLKGKIAIVVKDADGRITLDRFSRYGEFTDSGEYTASALLPRDIYAKRPDEIETLIKIGCQKKKDSAHYAERNSPSSRADLQEYENIICDVEVVDYKTATVVAKREVGDTGAPVVLYGGAKDNPKFPGEQIKEFLISFQSTLLPVTLATPTGEVLSALDLATKVEKSKESVSQYDGKEITVNGYAYISSSRRSDIDYSLSLGKKDYLTASTGSPVTLPCFVDPQDRASFATLKSGQYHNLTVVGAFESSYSRASLKHCRLVKAE